MLVHQKGQLELGAHPVGAGNQQRPLHTGDIRGKQPAKAPQCAHNTGNVGGFHQRLDAVDRLIPGGDVYASGGVGRGMRIIHGKDLQIVEIEKGA